MTDDQSVISSGTDWITVTEVTGDGVDDLAQIAYEIKQGFIDPQALSQSWQSQGYVGTQCGGLAFGTRGNNEAMMRVSGDLATKAYPAIPIDPKRVTRIDLQVTVALDSRDDRIAIRHYEHLRDLTNSGESDKVYKLISSPTGDTLYLGKRTHNKMLRFYDKSLDYGMGQTGWAWRYEVEYKKQAAKNTAKTVSYMKDPFADIANLVWQDYMSANFAPRYKRTGKITAMEVGTKYVTPEGQVKWLERSVAPVVTQLINMGMEERVIHALKLRDIKKGGKI